MIKRLLNILFCIIALSFSACVEKDTFTIFIEIPEEMADSMNCKDHRVLISNHFDKNIDQRTATIKDGRVEFDGIPRRGLDNLMDITIGDYTFHAVYDTIGNLDLRFIDAYKYIVNEGSEETYFISLYNNFYSDVRKKLEDNLDDLEEQEEIIKTYKIYTDSIMKRNPFTQLAYLHLAEQLNAPQGHDFDNESDRRLLMLATQAWKVRDENSKQYQRLLHMTEPMALELRKIRPYKRESDFVNLTLPDAHGDIRSLKDFEGKNIVLLFGSARKMEKKELKRIKEYYESTEDLEIYHVNFDKDEEAFREIAREYPWVMVNDPSFKSAITYQVDKVPTVYLFNKSSNCVAKNIDFVGYRF